MVGKNEKMIANYIKNQLEGDYAKDQISLKVVADPFTGERNSAESMDLINLRFSRLSDREREAIAILIEHLSK